MSSHLPSKQEILNRVCQLFNTGCTFDPNSPLVPDGALSIIGFALIAVFSLMLSIHCIICALVPKETSRIAALLGHFGFCIISICETVMFPFLSYAIVTRTAHQLPVFVYPTFIILSALLYSFMTLLLRSSLEIPISFFSAAIPFPIFIVLSFVGLYFFPQFHFSKCTSESLFMTVLDILVVSAYLTFAIGTFRSFCKMVNSEKLYIMKNGKEIGYLVKKGSNWVEVYAEKETSEHDETFYVV